MAILPNQLGVRVYITDNDGTLPEYDDDDDEPAEPNTTTKYIEAVSDSRFEIRFAFSHPFPTQYGVHVIFYLDGVRVRSRTLKVTELLGTGGREKKHSCRRTHFRKDGINYAQNFQFSKLVTDEDSDQLLGADTARALDQTGQITVKLYYVHNVQERSGRPGGPAKCLHHFDRLPEKAMKGKTLSHSISLGEPHTTRESTTSRTFDHVDPGKIPFGTFNFKYRSHAALQSLFIKPRSLSPDLQNHQSESEHRREDLQGFGREAAVREANVKKELKRETFDDDDDDEVIFISAKRRHIERRQLQDGDEIIELD